VKMKFTDLSTALASFKKGEPVIVVDALSRENEGDIVFPADASTPEKINFCALKARGLICIAMDTATAERIDLKPLRSNQKDQFHTAFYDPIDAASKHGTTTGISAFERSITARLVTDKNATPDDFIKPGHLFPVIAKKHGLLERQGHTEASVDLCKITGHYPAAIICEIMQEDGTMMRRERLFDFASKHNLPIITIQQILDHRLLTENHVTHISTAELPTKFGSFTVHSFKNNLTSTEHLALQKNTNAENRPIVRIHSECLTGDVFSSLRCDCNDQLEKSMRLIHENGNGILIYLKGHEGRGIGISNKIAAYALQERGLNTFEANEELGLPRDNRDYQDAIWILKYFHIDDFDLITNNNDKLNTVHKNGLSASMLNVHSQVNTYNERYLQDKIKIARHHIILEQ
jgi:3,4-dihydroxy 2-butanone 4-phosphate synthase/GTP cyclohydrolase II